MNNSLVGVQNSLVPSFLIHPIYDVVLSNYSYTFVVDILYGCATFSCAIILYQFFFSRSLTSFVVGGRMAQNDGVGGDDKLPPPPPVHPTLLEILRRSEESRQAQNQIMQVLVQNLGGQGHGGQRHGYSAFMATDPPIFRGSKEPLDADFWLRAMEQKFGLINAMIKRR